MASDLAKTTLHLTPFDDCFLCPQSDSYVLNNSQLSTIPLDEFAVERETQFQEPPAARTGQQDQG